MKVLVFTIALVLTGISSVTVMATEEAEFEVIASDGSFEVRDYSPQVVAEIQISKPFEDAGNEGFSKLFRYISGSNQTNDKIAMTTPVAQEQQSEKIAMTSPVGQRPSDNGWAVSFMLPAEYNIDTAPTPTDPAVSLRAIPERRMATIRYSGRWTEKNYLKYLEQLEDWIDSQGMTVLGDPIWARYNPPFTPPFWRRNEILIPVES